MHTTVVAEADARAKLLAWLTSTEGELEARIAAGIELARLGDPRATAIDRVLIEGGSFVFGGVRAEGSIVATGGREVFISTFAIDRYPTTVGAFAEFIDAGGYRERRFWSREGWLYKTAERIDRPRFWGESEWSGYLVPNHPVVGVSFYEAEAYAAFRDARLPTEAEWEKACRGADGRCHPWGDPWRADASGSRGVGPRGTVPIGTYAHGKTPLGVSDLVGSVWQWCRDVLDADADLDDEDPLVDAERYDPDAHRVTKGGGWNNLPWNVCCTNRNGYPPGARFSNLGFRCVAERSSGL